MGEKYQMAGKCFAFPIIDIILLAPNSLKSSFPNLVNDTIHTLDFITNTLELLIIFNLNLAFCYVRIHSLRAHRQKTNGNKSENWHSSSGFTHQHGDDLVTVHTLYTVIIMILLVALWGAWSRKDSSS